MSNIDVNAVNSRMIINLAVLVINFIVIWQCFPKKYSLRLIIGSTFLLTVVLIFFLRITGLNATQYGMFAGMPYIILIIIMFSGKIFQKLFALILQILTTASLAFIITAVIETFPPMIESRFYTIQLIVTLFTLLCYFLLILKFGRYFIEKLFASGRSSEWALYAFGIAFAYVVLLFLREAAIPSMLYIILLLFILWGAGVLCFAIINTHEKTKQKYEAELARGIVSSGSEHYQKMNEMYDTLRVMRHDYKFHLNATLDMLRRGDVEQGSEYLSELQDELSKHDPPNYCDNIIINSLFGDYAERCNKSGIEHDIKISLPNDTGIPNYDICIVLGNLLENAVEACQKLDDERMLQLVVKTQGEQLAIMVRNNYNGSMKIEGERIASTKKDGEGGFGLKSVQAVASRNEGNLFTEYDGEWFKAFVLLRLQRGIEPCY